MSRIPTAFRLGALLAVLAIAGCDKGPEIEVTLLNVSYDPTRELY